MKKTILTTLAFLVACSVVSSCQAKDKVIQIKDLPQVAQTFVSTHFSDKEVSLVIKDGNEYEVRFVNGWEVDFDKKGEWEKVDCQNDSVPCSVIGIVPESIPAYLNENFEKAFVTEIGKEHNGYDIELSNGIGVDFSLKGQFKRIDD